MWTEDQKIDAVMKYFHNQNYEKTAKTVGCSVSTLRVWVKQYRTTGSLAPKASKTCTTYCVKTFVPERERVENAFAKEHKVPYKTTPAIKKLYVTACEQIYCRKECKDKAPLWAPTITASRKKNLMAKGAESGCRDVVKEFPKYYKNNV